MTATGSDTSTSSTTTFRAAQTVMRVGLAIAFVLMAIGLVVHLANGGDARAVTFRQVLSAPRLGDKILMAGALVLAVTPAIQILVLLVDWLRIRDYRYAAVAAAVIVMLAIGALLGGA